MADRRLKLNEYEYFFALVQKCRLCCIGGAHIGKTALAVRLAQDFRKAGYRLWANIEVQEAGNLDKIFAVDPAERSCIILESAGLQLSDERHAEAFLDHIRSRNIIVLMPSIIPPHDLLRAVECHVYIPRWRWYLPRRCQPQGLECQWSIGRATYPGSKGRFRWRNPEEVYGLYDHRDPGRHAYMDGYSTFVWRQTMQQALRDMDGPVTIADFDILARPGQLFMLCLWLHSQLGFLLALKQASSEERDHFRQDPFYLGSITTQREELHRKNLGTLLAEFSCVFGSELADEDRGRLEELKDIRNSFAHSFFSLHHLEDQGGFVSYAPKRKEEKDLVWRLFTDEKATQYYMKDFVKLGECLHRLCRNMNIAYDRIL